MAPAHAAARRAVEYYEYDAPLMEDDMAVENSNSSQQRPSLLAYRPSMRNAWMPPPVAKLRYQQQPQQHQQQPQQTTGNNYSRESMGNVSVWTTDDEDAGEYRFGNASDDDESHSPEAAVSRVREEDHEEEESKEDEETDDDLFASVIMMEELPTITIAIDDPNVPILEVDEQEPEKEVDVILGDLTRLPRMTIIDDDGFLIDPRASSGNNDTQAMVDASAGLVRPGVVIKSGLLFKQGFRFMNGGWKVRYVQLTSSKLTFFKEENGRKRGEIDLAKCSVKSIEIMPQDSVFDGSQATMWRFAIQCKGRRVLLSAYTEQDMKEWLRCLHVALAVQSAGAGRFTDLVVPNGTLLAGKGDGLMRSSGSRLQR